MNTELYFDTDELTRYLAHHVPGFEGPMSVKKFAGGQSNPTFLLDARSGRYVLRRQPPGALLKSAHAVDREFRVLTALASTPVPVAKAWHLCLDRDVIGSLFYVMSFEEGRIFWDPALPDISPQRRDAFYRASIEAMATLHDVDIEAVGLSDFGRHASYFERQIAVWTKQYRASQTDDMPAIDALIDWLPANCPAQSGRPSLVHGDFRMDNLVFDQDTPTIRAILDWELSTLGNPLADLAYFCTCLRLPPGGHLPGLSGLDRAALGIPDEAALVEHYCERRGIASISNWNFYIAFSFFRLAAIAQGVKKREMEGNASSAQAREIGTMVGLLAQLGADQF